MDSFGSLSDVGSSDLGDVAKVLAAVAAVLTIVSGLGALGGGSADGTVEVV